MKTKSICIGLALFAGILGHSETARADEPCSDSAFLAGLCEVLGSLIEIDIDLERDAGTAAEPPAPQDPAPQDPAPTDSSSSDASTSGTSSTSDALTTGTSQSYTSKDSERSGPSVLDPVAAASGESPATVDLGEVGGGGGCTLAGHGDDTPSASAAGLGAIALVVARVARRRRQGAH